jgi:uncharacterized alpha-E superfamily protein
VVLDPSTSTPASLVLTRAGPASTLWRVLDEVRSATEVRTRLRSCAWEAVIHRIAAVVVARPGMCCAASLSNAFCGCS